MHPWNKRIFAPDLNKSNTYWGAEKAEIIPIEPARVMPGRE